MKPSLQFMVSFAPFRSIRRLFASAIISGIALSAASVHAITIDFTADEGYASGQLTNHADWDTSWRYSVNPTSGIVSWTNGSNGAAVYGQAQQIGGAESVISSSMVFRIQSLGGGTVASSVYMATLGFSVGGTQADAQAANDNVKLIFARLAGEANYKLYFTTQQDPWTATNVSLSSVGDTSVTGEWTDWLTLTLTLTKGENASDWSLGATIYNNSTSSIVASLSFGGKKTSEAFYNSDLLYANFQTGNGTTGLEIDEFSVSAT